MSGLITYESDERIALITINRPEKMNALSNDLVAALRDAFIKYRDSDVLNKSSSNFGRFPVPIKESLFAMYGK